MSASPEESKQREEAACAAMRKMLGTDGEESVDLYISHHIAEIESSYWRERLGTDSPSPQQVFDLLVLKGSWEDEEDGEFYDFTLPGDVTQYVICVRFDEQGNVDEISMES